jgi:hypothetical protein
MKHPFLIKDGDKLAVLRPKDPQLAMKLAYAAAEIEDDQEREKAFQAVLTAQPYSFVGLMAVTKPGKPGKLLDEGGWAIGSVRPGDSFAPYADIFAHSDAVAQAIASGDESVILQGEAKDGPGISYEVQQDGTLGPIRSGA